MRGDYAAVYQEHQRRVVAEREERLFAADYLASQWTDVDLADTLGPGWRRLIRELHRTLIGLDPAWRLIDVRQKSGFLSVRASFTPERREVCRDFLARMVAQSSHTCEVCAALGRAREERVFIHTLCDACWSADRALAAERGERYANLMLARLLSDDPRYPEPDEILAFLDGGHD